MGRDSIRRSQGRLQFVDRRSKSRCRQIESLRFSCFLDKKQRPLRTQINLQSRFTLQLIHKLWIHGSASPCQLPECSPSFAGKLAQHATRSPRGLTPGFALIHDEHSQSLLVQFDCQREPDDARPDDDCVIIPHVLHFSRKSD